MTKSNLLFLIFIFIPVIAMNNGASQSSAISTTPTASSSGASSSVVYTAVRLQRKNALTPLEWERAKKELISKGIFKK